MRSAQRFSAAVITAAFALTLTAGLGVAAPAEPVPPRPAEASNPVGIMGDAHPCSGQVGSRDGRPIYNCPLWGGEVPVYEDTDDPRQPFRNRVVGVVNSANTNWFWCQQRGGWFGSQHGYNYWWAQTKADNLAVGWVPVYYFAGGGNDEPDGSLRHC